MRPAAARSVIVPVSFNSAKICAFAENPLGPARICPHRPASSLPQLWLVSTKNRAISKATQATDSTTIIATLRP